MHERCRNPRHIGFRYYGARGITVCERWRDFAAFLADVGPRPKGWTLDRINPDGDYEPGNVRWVSPSDQRKNQRPYDESARVQRSWDTGKRSRVSGERQDLTGQRFSRLTVLRYAGFQGGRARWVCRCDCGTEKVITGKSLRRGDTQSCGCAQFDAIKQLAALRTSEEQRARAIKGWQTRRGKQP